MAPLSMYEEVNTGNNLPAQIELYAEPGDAYNFLFIAKGGGSANKTLPLSGDQGDAEPEVAARPSSTSKIRTLGTAACPPYHLAIVIGGTSAEMTLKTVKLASCRYLDDLPTPATSSATPIRDREFEQEVLELTRAARHRRAVRRQVFLPRRAGDPPAAPRRQLPIGIGVSCSADRQILGKITADGVFLEQLETNPAQYLPEIDEATLGGEVVRDRPAAGR